MPKSIKEQLSSVMTEDQMSKFDSAIKTMISEGVEAGVKAKEREIKAQYEETSQTYCEKMISEGVETAKVGLIREYDAKMVILEEKVTKDLRSFIDSEIIPQIDKNLIRTSAINEAAMPIVIGIVKVLEENYVAADTHGSSLLREAKEEINSLTKQLNGAIKDKMALNGLVGKVASSAIITESVAGLKPSQVSRVKEMFAGKSFTEIKGKIGSYIKFLVESEVRSIPKGRTMLNEAAVTPREILEESTVITPDFEEITEAMACQDAANMYL